MDPKTRIALVGATGVVGREVLAGLSSLGVAPEQLTLFASSRSEGEELDFDGETLAVEPLAADSFRGVGLALFAAPAEVARAHAPAAQAAGAWVVDASPAFRGQPQVPLILPGVNQAALASPFQGRIVACPGSSTAGLVTALEPWRQAFGLEEVHVTSLLGASDKGRRGVSELEGQTASLLSGRDLEPGHFPHRLAFNLIPQVGDFEGEWCQEERSISAECARLWSGPRTPPVSATAIQVPTFYGCCLSVVVRLSKAADAAGLKAALSSGPQLKLLDDPAQKIYPMPMLCTADPSVLVGRVRSLPGRPDWASLFVAVDNAGRGSALNVVEVGNQLARQLS